MRPSASTTARPSPHNVAHSASVLSAKLRKLPVQEPNVRSLAADLEMLALFLPMNKSQVEHVLAKRSKQATATASSISLPESLLTRMEATLLLIYPPALSEEERNLRRQILEERLPAFRASELAFSLAHRPAVDAPAPSESSLASSEARAIPHPSAPCCQETPQNCNLSKLLFRFSITCSQIKIKKTIFGFLSNDMLFSIQNMSLDPFDWKTAPALNAVVLCNPAI